MKITYNSTNYYLEPCDSGFLLIDAGWYGKGEVFRKELNLLGIKPEQIKYILLTHHHHDHSAIVEELKISTNAKLIVHEKQIPYLKTGVTNDENIKQYNWVLWIIDKLTKPFVKYKYPPISINNSDIIIDTDANNNVLRSIGISGKIISTPGHSSDSISVLLDNGIAYVGDLAMNMSSMKLIGKIPLPIEAEDFEQVKSSMKRLVDLGCIKFYPSHGDVIVKEMIECII
ncbi:MBL fold metallo-hydrolase [Bacteroides thetaiotaomicron]|uniref:Hydroxyacylglutathione hydrolase n=1 Tax=Bacteroides thetaiotaomicron TaxID=818 RepID=A0A174NXH7_BACT4|nr:MBL fold metallo-hydrolase [Bacteroides thetaiotaomicron]CUP51318.1 hydroxyacylglutathione hydrolase [Bacteroides thetaiotaomicron]